MITLIVKIDIKPDYYHAFLHETLQARNTVLQTEKGCIAYVVNHDKDNENGVILVEVYEDQDAIDIHKTSEHFLYWRNTTQDYIISKKVTDFLTSI